MIRRHYENRVPEPGLAFCVIDEFTYGVVGVFYRSAAAAGRSDIDPPVRVGVRAVIGRGHDMREERLARGRFQVQRFQGVVVQDFVGDSPDVLKDNRGGGEIPAVDHPVIIAAEIAVHIVEVAVPAVDEERGNPLLPEQSAQRGKVLVARAPHHGLPRDRRQTEGERLQTAHRAGPCGEDAF